MSRVSSKFLEAKTELTLWVTGFNSPIAISDGGHEPLVFDTTIKDSNGSYNNTTGEWTADKTGSILVLSTAGYDSPPGIDFIGIELRQQGTLKYNSYVKPPSNQSGTTFMVPPIEYSLDVTVGDVIKITGANVTGVTRNILIGTMQIIYL